MDAPNCEHCGARLATIACPSCFGMMFVGEKFCSHCGAQAARFPKPNEVKHSCPRCKNGLQPIQVGKTPLEECGSCHGSGLIKSALSKSAPVARNGQLSSAILLRFRQSRGWHSRIRSAMSRVQSASNL